MAVPLSPPLQAWIDTVKDDPRVMTREGRAQLSAEYRKSIESGVRAGHNSAITKEQ